MDTEVIIALVVSVLFIGSIVFLEIHSRRSKGKVEKVDEPEGGNREQ